jgi:hypothetical protein
MSASTLLSGTPAGLDAGTINVNSAVITTINAGGPQGGMAIVTNPQPGSLAGLLLYSQDVADQTSFRQQANSAADSFSVWSQYVAGTAGGGLDVGKWYLYNNTTTAGVAAPAVEVIEADNADGSVSANVRPRVAARVGTTTGTGAPLVVVVAGMTANSIVLMSVVGSTGAVPAGPWAAPAPASAAGQFSYTGVNGLIYSYYVLG